MNHWIIWAGVLLAQNFSFTFVSRARNSGSLRRHVIAGLASNGVWFWGQGLVVAKFYELLTGRLGFRSMLIAGAFYTACTVAGSVLAHYWALRTEKGKASVGANSKYAQIPVEEWAAVKKATGLCAD